jgi:drug/metabolite transporter (DMT)-like permease
LSTTELRSRPDSSPTALAIAGAGIISFSAILYRLSDVDAISGGFFRMAYAVPALAVLWWIRRASDKRTRRERILAMASGVLLGLDVICWQLAIDQIGAGLATLVANTQVVIVPLVTWLLFAERPSNRVFAAMPIVVAGLAAVTGLGDPGAFGDRPVFGVFLGVAAAALYSGFLIGFRRSSKRLAPAAGPLLDATVGAALAIGLVGIALGQLTIPSGLESHAWLVLLALGPQAAGWLAIGYALPRLPAAITSFVILLQPTLTIIWAYLIFAETPSIVQLTGVVLVVSGVVMVATNRSRT